MFGILASRKARFTERPIDAEPFLLTGGNPSIAAGPPVVLVSRIIRMDVQGLRINRISYMIFGDLVTKAGLRKNGNPYNDDLYNVFWGGTSFNGVLSHMDVFALYEPGELIEFVVQKVGAGNIAAAVALSGWYF